MPTCVIRHRIDPTRPEAFVAYARGWNEAIPRCGARPIDYRARREGSSALGYDVHDADGLAAHGARRARLGEDPAGRENAAFAGRERFLLDEDRTLRERVAPEGE